MDRDRVVAGFFNADNFLVKAQRDADAAHLILQGFNDLAIDELEQSRPAFYQHDGNAEGGQNRRVLAADHSTAYYG